MKISIFPGKYHQNDGLSMVIWLVYRSVTIVLYIYIFVYIYIIYYICIYIIYVYLSIHLLMSDGDVMCCFPSLEFARCGLVKFSISEIPKQFKHADIWIIIPKNLEFLRASPMFGARHLSFQVFEGVWLIWLIWLIQLLFNSKVFLNEYIYIYYMICMYLQMCFIYIYVHL